MELEFRPWRGRISRSRSRSRANERVAPAVDDPCGAIEYLPTRRSARLLARDRLALLVARPILRLVKLIKPGEKEGGGAEEEEIRGSRVNREDGLKNGREVSDKNRFLLGS